MQNDMQCRKAELSPPWTSSSLVSCVAGCKERFQNLCNNVVYNKLTSTCTPVHPMAFSDPELVSQPGDELFSLQDKELTCDVAAGFQLQQACGAASCLLFNKTKTVFAEAQAACEAAGSTLFIPDTFERFALLPVNAIKQYWVGLKRSDNSFVWVNGNSVDLSFFNFMWAERQPDNYKGIEDCVIYFFKHATNNKLHDYPCNHEHEFICEQN
ncbi:C-type lectin domain family 10 member A [Elysia marginata]|uniref:C-type lectin domain family 10 member A n=1 Tax=Elysia marginata TaxID=1093978 RepID=A0AAV4K0M2_9GAST|nr:C-type lectin domain family 10 member A [Elysia marginata]